MIALKTIDIKNDFKRISNLILGGEKVLISRPRNENLIILTEKEYNELEKIRRNNEYLLKIDKSLQQVSEGKIVTKTMEELEAMTKWEWLLQRML